MRAWIDSAPMFDNAVHEPPEVPGYRLVKQERIPISRVSTIGLFSAPIWLAGFAAIARLLGGYQHPAIHITFVGVIIAVLILTLIMPFIHEAIHGIFALAFGAMPKFGVGAGFAYTTFRKPVRRAPYLVIGLTPLILISIAGLMVLVGTSFYPGQTLVFLVGNAAGAFGDLWVALKVVELPRGCLISDLADGFAYYLPEGQSASE